MSNYEESKVTEINEVSENIEAVKVVDEKSIISEYEDLLGY